MKRVCRTIGMIKAALVPLLAVALMPAVSRAEVIDRIVATVNGHIILQSDWDDALRYEALLNARGLGDFSDDDRRAVLDRLIDQELLGQQMNAASFQHCTEAEAAAQIADARKQYRDADKPEGWQSVLSSFQLTEKDLLSHVQRQIDLTRLVDAHLRPEVQIDSKSIEAYYREKFVPQLKQSGSSGVALADVSGQIRELLIQEKVNQLLVSWLQTLRSESKVIVPAANPFSPEGVQTQ
jgi:peptidyl-prolyl cis-trans isomerase SurA